MQQQPKVGLAAARWSDRRRKRPAAAGAVPRNQPDHAIGRETRRRKGKVRTRERGRPSGQERSILNAVPGSAAEAGTGAAIRAPGAGGAATETGLAGARQRRSAAGWVSEATYSTVGDAIYRAFTLCQKNSIDKHFLACLNVGNLQIVCELGAQTRTFCTRFAVFCVRY